MTKGRARMFALQHRLNTRQRNSVLKLKVATNCPDWETRMRVIGACSEEVIADILRHYERYLSLSADKRTHLLNRAPGHS